MSVDVHCADEQSDRILDLARWSALARSVLEQQGVREDAEVSLLFVDEETIAGLNERFLEKPGPTDVLAFPIEDDPVPSGRWPDVGGNGPGAEPEDQPTLLLGDVVICPAVAATHAVEHGVSEEDELALLVVHGLLHLLGFDHQENAEAERMERLERQLLAQFNRPGPASPAPAPPAEESG